MHIQSVFNTKKVPLDERTTHTSAEHCHRHECLAYKNRYQKKMALCSCVSCSNSECTSRLTPLLLFFVLHCFFFLECAERGHKRKDIQMHRRQAAEILQFFHFALRGYVLVKKETVTESAQALHDLQYLCGTRYEKRNTGRPPLTTTNSGNEHL